jgi:hypothetical protein
VLYSIVGLIGFLAFGMDSKDLMIFNLPMKLWYFAIIKVLYCFVILFSYPLQLFPVVNYVENKYRMYLFGK